MQKISLMVLALISTACMSDKLPKYSELSGLRILALVAATPEVDAGGSTTITPLVSDINETTSLSYEATGCIPVTTADSSCSGNSTATSLASGTLSTGDMTTAKAFTGSAAAFTVNVPAAGVIYQTRSNQDQFNGVSYLVTYKLTNSRGGSVDSYRRIIVSTRSPKNQNPILSDVLNNGAVFSSTIPTSEIEIAPSFGAGQSETFQELSNSGEYKTETEELITTWFASDGHFKYYRTLTSDKNLYTGPESAPTARDAFIIAVTRDGRGGIGFKRKCFGTCPP